MPTLRHRAAVIAVITSIATAASATPATPATPEQFLLDADWVVIGKVVESPWSNGGVYTLRIESTIKGPAESAALVSPHALKRKLYGEAYQPAERKGERIVAFFRTRRGAVSTMNVTSLAVLDEFRAGSGAEHICLLRALRRWHEADRDKALAAWVDAIGKGGSLRTLALDRISRSGRYEDIEPSLEKEIQRVQSHRPLRLASAVMQLDPQSPALRVARIRAMTCLAEAIRKDADASSTAVEIARREAVASDDGLRREAFELLAGLRDPTAAKLATRLLAEGSTRDRNRVLSTVATLALSDTPLRKRMLANSSLCHQIGLLLHVKGLQEPTLRALAAIVDAQAIDVTAENLDELTQRWALWLREND